MIYIRLQDHTNNMVVAEHGIQSYEVVVVMLFFIIIILDIVVPANAHP